jgi:general secretion pathway protein A
MNDLLSPFGLKFHPFRPEIPVEAIHPTPGVDAFCGRVEIAVGDGGFVMVTGEPGSGKSVALRLLAQRLGGLRDVVVGTIDHPQSRVSDFYRELGDIFSVPFPPHNRWAGFKTLRTRWGEHISKTMMRPVLIIDEAQEMLSSVFGELRVLTSDLCSASCSPATRACPSGCALPICSPSAAASGGGSTSSTLPATSCAPVSITSSTRRATRAS